jgi:hypothetical protein
MNQQLLVPLCKSTIIMLIVVSYPAGQATTCTSVIWNLKPFVEFWLLSLYVIRIEMNALLNVVVSKSWYMWKNKMCVYFWRCFEIPCSSYSLNTVSCTYLLDKLLIKPEESQGGFQGPFPSTFMSGSPPCYFTSFSSSTSSSALSLHFFVTLPASYLGTHSFYILLQKLSYFNYPCLIYWP